MPFPKGHGSPPAPAAGLQGPGTTGMSWFRSLPQPEGVGGQSRVELPPVGSGAPMPAGTPMGGVPSGGRPTAAPPAPSKKVARFIATEAAQSGLKLAEDGKLPGLRLKESGEPSAKQGGSRGVNPLLLFGALAFSLVSSVILVFLPSEPDAPVRSDDKRQARLEIQENYIAGMDKDAALESYQILLRNAIQARSRRDYPEERRCYRRVLDMLRTERTGKFEKGLTGSPARDETLEKLITTLLSD